MIDKANLFLRLFFVLILIIGAISAQLWVPYIFGINLVELSTRTLFLLNIGMAVVIFFILGRPIHFIIKALKVKE